MEKTVVLALENIFFISQKIIEELTGEAKICMIEVGKSDKPKKQAKNIKIQNILLITCKNEAGKP